MSLSFEGHLTAKSDVYSFGVVLLEILSGRRAIDKNRPSGEHNLVEWAKPYLTSKRRVLQMLDARIEGQYSTGGALKAAKLAIQCISTEPKLRPNMNTVVKALEQLQDSSETSGSRGPVSEPLNNSSQGSGSTDNKAVSYPRPSASVLNL